MDKQKKYCIGVDLGGTNISIGITDQAGSIVLKDAVKTRAGELDGTAIMANIAKLSQDLLERLGLSQDDILLMSLGIPGTVDNRKGTLIFSGNLYAEDWPFREELSKQFDCPIYLVNDANAAALAEARVGVGKDCESSIMITLGTGLGGGVVIHGELLTGFNNAGSELGHATIIMDGEQCTCGRKGCFEAYASATALVRQTLAKAKEYPDSLLAKMITESGRASARTAFEARKRGDEAGDQVVRQYVRYLAEGFANYIDCFMPEMIILGGGVCNEGQYFLDMIEEETLKHTFIYGDVARPKFAIASLGNDAGIVGAALYGLDCLQGTGLC